MRISDWSSDVCSSDLKVALIKDAVFFDWLEVHADALVRRDMDSMRYLIKQCGKLHLEHIAGGDPFELGSSRPLDFGHWSAHKLEQISDFEILHGEAVSIGIAHDCIYSTLIGLLPTASADRIVTLLMKVGLPISHPLMEKIGRAHV